MAFGGLTEGMGAAVKAARAAGIGVDEETRGAINSVQAMINTLPHDHPARAQLDDMLSGLQAGTVAPNQVQIALAHVRDIAQSQGGAGGSLASAAAFKAAMINDVSHPLVIEHAEYVMEGISHHLEGMDQEHVDEIEQATRRALAAQTAEERQAAEDQAVQAYIAGGGTDVEGFTRDWRAQVEAQAERLAQAGIAHDMPEIQASTGESLAIVRQAAAEAATPLEAALITVEGADIHAAAVAASFEEAGISVDVGAGVVARSREHIEASLETSNDAADVTDAVDRGETGIHATGFRVADASLSEERIPSSSPVVFDPGGLSLS